jgi:hypothetical protein
MSPLEATYRSKCSVCGEWIEEGDLIATNENGDWVHEECADE